MEPLEQELDFEVEHDEEGDEDDLGDDCVGTSNSFGQQAGAESAFEGVDNRIMVDLLEEENNKTSNIFIV